MTSKLNWLLSALRIWSIYVGWTLVFKLVAITLMTNALIYSTQDKPRLHDMSEFVAANEILVVGIGAFFFIVLSCWLHPLSSTSSEQVFPRGRVIPEFFPGLIRGFVLAAGLTLAFWLSGYYQFVGVGAKYDDPFITFLSLFVRTLCLLCMVYGEEFIFRWRMLRPSFRELQPVYGIVIVAIAYCAIKSIQFDLGTMHLITLFLISVACGIRSLDGNFIRGAGVWSGLLILFHPILGLPIFGSQFPGLVFLQYQAVFDSRTSLFLTGGIGGPLASFSFQLLLLVYIALLAWKRKKMIFRKEVSISN